MRRWWLCPYSSFKRLLTLSTLCGCIALTFCLFLRPILNSACEDRCAESHKATALGFSRIFNDVVCSSRTARCDLISRRLCSSVNSCWISAASRPGVRNSIQTSLSLYFVGLFGGCPSASWCIKTHLSLNLHLDGFCNSVIREDARNHTMVSCTSHATVSALHSSWLLRWTAVSDTLSSRRIFNLSTSRRGSEGGADFRCPSSTFWALRGGKYNCLLSNTLILLSIDSSLQILAQLRVNPCDSSRLLLFRSS